MLNHQTAGDRALAVALNPKQRERASDEFANMQHVRHNNHPVDITSLRKLKEGGNFAHRYQLLNNQEKKTRAHCTVLPALLKKKKPTYL